VAPNEQMPNAQYSSDHLALMSEFQYIRPKWVQKLIGAMDDCLWEF
jgi:hypothetical protein